MSATLRKRGADYESTVRAITEEHAGSQVEIVGYQDIREGGFLGFFARIGVEVDYRVHDDIASASSKTVAEADNTVSGVNTLISTAEAGDSFHFEVSDADPELTMQQLGPKSFSELLCTMAAAKSDKATSTSEAPEAPARLSSAPATSVASTQSAAVRIVRAEHVADSLNVAAAPLPDLTRTAVTDVQPAAAGTSTPAVASPLIILPSDFHDLTVDGQAAPCDISVGTEDTVAVRCDTVSDGTAQPPNAPPSVMDDRADQTCVRHHSGHAVIPVPPVVFRSATDGPLRSMDLRTDRDVLASIGVPAHLLPGVIQHHYAAVEAIVNSTTSPSAPPLGDGLVLAIVADEPSLVAAIVELRSHYSDTAIVLTRPVEGIDATTIIGTVSDARRVANLAREASSSIPVIVGIVPPPSGQRRSTGTPAALLAALDADLVWAHVNATRSLADNQRALRGLGRVDGLIVSDAHIAAAPASTLALNLPTVLIDGAPATRSQWAVLLLDKFTESRAECFAGQS